MFREILKLIPRIDNSDLNKMERTLTRRFAKIAKGFGKGVVGALAGGGLAGIGLSFLDKILNPLKDVQEAIDRSLKRGDDIVTNARQFGTTPARLAKLQAIGQSTGLDPESLSMLLTKFQTAVAEAQQDPKKVTSVRNFANEKDIAGAFLEFVRELQKLPTEKQVLVQQEVFGEKQILKMADFLQADFDKLIAEIKAPPAEVLNRALNKLGDVNDRQDMLKATQELNDLVAKANRIQADFVDQRIKGEQVDLDRENRRIESYKSLASISETSSRILQIVEGGALKVGDLLTKVTNLSGNVEKFINASQSFFKRWGGGK